MNQRDFEYGMSGSVARVDAAPRDAALGRALSGFDENLRRLRQTLAADATLTREVFEGSEAWSNLLAYKLVPHLAGEGCLIAAVTGGTNTGKSTVFNLLLGAEISPILATAAATARPVIAANATRAKQCLEGKLVPEFSPSPMDSPARVVGHDSPPDTLFVTTAIHLPDRLVLLDTPDVDSIDTEHWEVADAIRAAGDVLIAVLTGEKYKDDRVIAYFRQALASGRVIVPVMNKANPADDFAVARKQLAEFRELVGFDAPCFVLPHSFAIADNFSRPIPALDGEGTLFDYLLSLDAPAIKRRVYRDSVKHFAAQAGAFLDHTGQVRNALAAVVDEFEARAALAASKYDPAPGAAVGGLFHEYVQSKRSLVFRWIGAGSRGAARGAALVGRTISGAFRKRATLERRETPPTDKDLHAAHAKAIERIARDLAAGYIQTARNLREPASHLVHAGVTAMQIDTAAPAIVKQTIHSESISEEFRQHAYRMLDSWWHDHKGKRRILEALDGILALTPAAIAVPISMHTAGVGVDVAIAVAGPMVEQFFARVIEYQFGDAMFDFLSPWRREQQQALEASLKEHLAGPCLTPLRTYLGVFDGNIMSELRRFHESCLII